MQQSSSADLSNNKIGQKYSTRRQPGDTFRREQLFINGDLMKLEGWIRNLRLLGDEMAALKYSLRTLKEGLIWQGGGAGIMLETRLLNWSDMEGRGQVPSGFNLDLTWI